MKKSFIFVCKEWNLNIYENSTYDSVIYLSNY